MRTTLTTLATTLLLVTGASATAFAATENKNPSEAITIDILGVERPAVIVSNPFYGLTDLLRGVKDSFTSDKVSRFLTRLEALNRKAAELLTTRKVAGSNVKLTTKATAEYQVAMYQYSLAAAKLSNEELRQVTPAVLQNVFVHLRFIDEQLALSSTTADKALYLEIMERCSDTAIELIDRIGIEEVRTYAQALVQPETLTDLRTAEMLAILAQRAANKTYSDVAQQLLALRSELLDGVAERLTIAAAPAPVAFAKSATLSVIESVPAPAVNPQLMSMLGQLAGSPGQRAQTLSYLTSRPELLGQPQLVALRNGLLMELFAK